MFISIIFNLEFIILKYLFPNFYFILLKISYLVLIILFKQIQIIFIKCYNFLVNLKNRFFKYFFL
jgi:hypothetical protein